MIISYFTLIKKIYYLYELKKKLRLKLNKNFQLKIYQLKYYFKIWIVFIKFL